VPLVGLIEPGTVERVLKSVAYAKGNVLVLLEQEHCSGHVLFEKGSVITARVENKTGQAALGEMTSWIAGHYSLLKRQQKEVESKGHVLLNSLELKSRRAMERWLKREGFTSSIVGYPQHAMQVISYIQPDVILMPCPRPTLKLTCAELRDALKEALGVAPLLIVVETAAKRCEDPQADCVRTSTGVDGLKALLSQTWPETRLAVRAQSEEATAKIFRPAPLPADLDRVKLQSDEYAPLASRGPTRVTARDLALVFGALVLGSAAVWSTYLMLIG